MKRALPLALATVIQLLAPQAMSAQQLARLEISLRAATQNVDHAPPALSPQELFKRLSPSIFIVVVFDKDGAPVALGSGVAVAPDQIITNKHVIEGGASLQIKQGSTTWSATVAYLDPDHDLCRLKVEGLRAPAVSVRLSSVLNVGERVYSIGAPEGLELTISEGLISGLREFEQARLIQTSAAISHGSSGGGLFDARGKLVGITTFFLKEGQSLNFALPGEWVREVASHNVSLGEEKKAEPITSYALSWYQLGIQEFDAGNYKDAERAFRWVISMAPSLGEGWSCLGLTYDYLQEYDKAIPAFQAAIRLRPDLSEAWNGLGYAYMQLHQDDQSLEAFHEAVRLKPDDYTAWNNLGLIYGLLHKYEKAIPAFQEAIRLKSGISEPWYGLGVAYDNLQQYEKAINAYQEAIRLKQDDAHAWYKLGLTYDAKGDRSGVAMVYEKLKTLDQNLAEDLSRRTVPK